MAENSTIVRWYSAHPYECNSVGLPINFLQGLYKARRRREKKKKKKPPGMKFKANAAMHPQQSFDM